MRSAILGMAVLLGACTSNASESSETYARGERSFEVGGFDRVMLAGSQNVVIRVGAAPSVRAEGDAEALERLDIGVERGQLRIGSRRTGSMSWAGGRGSGVTVHVTVPALTAAEVAGSGDMRIDRIEAERFNASIAGSGNMEIGAVAVEQGDFSVAGSGNMRAAGRAAQAEISIAGSGDLDLGALETRTAAVRVMGSGDATVRATETANITTMGSGDVTVTGGARCSTRTGGSGSVNCG